GARAVPARSSTEFCQMISGFPPRAAFAQVLRAGTARAPVADSTSLALGGFPSDFAAMLKSSLARGLPGIRVLAMATLVTGSETQPSTNALLKYEEPRALSATIYPLTSDRKQPLFEFHRQASRQGDRLNVVREYSYPDGRLAAREHAVYQGDSLI